jgi:hypothetical protein
MTPEAIRRLTLVHGIVAWLDALLLLVVAILLIRKKGAGNPWFRSLAVMATLAAMGSFASGMALELHYRVHLRQRLFIASKTLGWLFERKMHLSFGVLIFATIGLLTLVLSRKDERFFPSMRIAYLLTAICALTASIISAIVRIARPFG